MKDLFGNETAVAGHYEMHEHCFIRGERSHFAGRTEAKISHSHAGGDLPHKHPDTGPASYTIDKDEWLEATGLTGGARKKFTVLPTGEQLPSVELEDWQKSFEVIVGPVPAGAQFEGATGPGLALPMRMILGSKMTISNVTPLPSPRRTS